MKNSTEFIEEIVKIDFLENYEQYGHYPHQLYVIDKDDKIIMNAMAMNGVENHYRAFKRYKDEGAKKIFMSLDFPSGRDIESDFVGVFSYNGKDIELIALPYDIHNGEKSEIIKEGDQILTIYNQFINFIK